MTVSCDLTTTGTSIPLDTTFDPLLESETHINSCDSLDSEYTGKWTDRSTFVICISLSVSSPQHGSVIFL